MRFGELTPEEGERALALVQGLRVELISPDEEQVRSAFEWTIRLDRAAAYDSFYLALAEKLGCMLWTADQGLCNTVDLPWVRIIVHT